MADTYGTDSTSQPDDDVNMSTDLTYSIDDVQLSIQGITFLMNDEWQEAEMLFNKYREYSPMMSFGSSFVMVMQGIMSFEEEKLQAALEALKDTERRCCVQTGFTRSMKKKKKKYGSLEDRLIRQVVVGDCLLYQAIVICINQDTSSYIKGGWCLRKSWKLYEKTFKEITQIHERAKAKEANCAKHVTEHAPHFVEIPVGLPNRGNSPLNRSPSGSREGDFNWQGNVDPEEEKELTLNTASRLLGSVSFGYGVLQLVISLVPPRMLKPIEFLGFEGDRPSGIRNLELASNSKDMKAPLAMFALIWYHAVIRPFSALDGTNLNAGILDAEIVIERCRRQYPESSIYLLFKARVLRLRAQVDEALSTYQLAMERCRNQREIQLISLYEIGWLHMMTLNYPEAYICFLRLMEESRWSKCYYAYLAAICLGASGDVIGACDLLKQVPSLQKRKNNQLETFVSKRAKKMISPTQDHFSLCILEVLYLWSAIPNCKRDDLQKHLDECNRQADKKLFHLRRLVEGALYRELCGDEIAAQCFQEAITRQRGMKEDKYVAAFASYELGIIYAQNEETLQQGKKLFLKVKDDYKDFDFDNRLLVRVQAALKRIKDGKPV